jgi:5'-nucleotidase
VDPNGRPYFWFDSMRVEGKPNINSDLGAIRENAISITPLNLDLTHKSAIKNLKKMFS